MVYAIIPRSSNSSCNVTASHTRQAAQIIQDVTDSLREWLVFAKKLMDKDGKEGNHGFQVCLSTRSHPSQAALHHLCN